MLNIFNILVCVYQQLCKWYMNQIYPSNNVNITKHYSLYHRSEYNAEYILTFKCIPYQHNAEFTAEYI